MEERPSVGEVRKGDLLVANEVRQCVYFTVRAAKDGERPIAVAATNSHALGFVALSRLDPEVVDAMIALSTR